MSRRISYHSDDNSIEIVKRYEEYLKGRASGYFDVDDIEEIAEYYLQNGRMKDSDGVIDFGLHLHPNNYNLKTKRAKIYLKKGEYQKAILLLNTLPETEESEINFLKIETLLYLNKSVEAAQLAKQLILNEITENPDIYFETGSLFILHNEMEIGLEILLEGDKIISGNIDFLFELAMCYEQLGFKGDKMAYLSKAVETYRRIISLDSYSVEAWFNLGELLSITKNYNQALEAYEFAQTIAPNDPLICLQKSHTLFQLNQFEEAIEGYTEYGELTDNKAEAAVYIGECYEKLEQYPEAIAYYNQVYATDPNNFEALLGISYCLLEQDLYSESLVYIHKAIDIDSNTSDVWVFLGDALMGLNNEEEALNAYLYAIKLEPNQPDTLLSIGNIYMEYGEFDTAMEYYILAQEFDAEIEYIHLFMAVAKYKSHDPNQAIDFLRIALSKNTDALELFNELCPESIIDEQWRELSKNT